MKKIKKWKTTDSPAYLKQAPTGIPGAVSRPDETMVQPAMLVALSSVFMQRFGEAVRFVTGGIQQWTTGLTKADFAGVLIREVPSIAGTAASDSTFSGTVPNPDQVQGFSPRGFVTVKCTHGTPARGGIVYVRIIDETDRPIGAFEADSDSSDSVALDANQAVWASDGLDADGNAELWLIANG